MGADFCSRHEDNLIEIIRDNNRGYLADLVILCFEGFSELALQSIERGGTMIFFSGASQGATLNVPINEVLWRREVCIRSTYAGAPYDCYQALSLIREGILPVSKLITHRLSLEEGQRGFQMVSSPVEHECIKVIIEPNR
jgi:L-iditol 2-dehydrogenase